jgi:predicted RNA-binding Zn-ribbon protein involved in translation (DUF1610 family)
MLPNWQNFPVIPNVRELCQVHTLALCRRLTLTRRLPQPQHHQQSWTMNTDWVTVSFSKAYLDAKERQRVSFPSRLLVGILVVVLTLTSVNATHRPLYPCHTWYQHRKFSMSLRYSNCSVRNRTNSCARDISAGVTSLKHLKPNCGVNTTATTFCRIKNHASQCRYAKSH